MMTCAEVLCLLCSRPCGARVRRGLCRYCSADPKIRARFPSRTAGPKDGAHGPYSPDRHTLGELPERTDAAPGSPEKQKILQQRAQAQPWQQLFRRDEPSLPLSHAAYFGRPGDKHAHRYDDHVRLWRYLVLRDPSIVEVLKQMAYERREPPPPSEWED
jgi:hypothetical protein